MIAGIVRHILDSRESLSVRVACLSHQLFSLRKVSLKVVCVEELTILLEGHICKRGAWLYIGNARAHKILSCGIGSLHDGICNVGSVKSKA